jgi:hypothetical protein
MDTRFDIERFERSHLIQKLNKSSQTSVMNVVRSIADGRSIVYKGRVFPPLKDRKVTHRCLLEDGLYVAVKGWCPRATKKNKVDFCDTSRGWRTDDPVNRMIKFVRWEIQPDADRKDAEDMMKARAMRRLDHNELLKRKRKTWSVSPHSRSNTEETQVSVPFLAAFCKKASNDWVYDTEYAFGDRTRCDILLHNARTNTFVIVESKQGNALHALGQLVHYHRMALASVPGYAVARSIHVVAVMKEPSRYVYETVTSCGNLVWWPGNDNVLDACFD